MSNSPKVIAAEAYKLCKAPLDANGRAASNSD